MSNVCLYLFKKNISAVDRHRCIIQPDKTQFTSGVALLTTLLMVAASILLSLPMYQSAEVRIFTEIPLYVFLFIFGILSPDVRLLVTVFYSGPWPRVMAIRVVEFSNGVCKIRKIFA